MLGIMVLKESRINLSLMPLVIKLRKREVYALIRNFKYLKKVEI